MRVSFLEVNWHRIMNGTLNPDVLQGQSERDRALEFQSRSNARRILNRTYAQAACMTSPSVILCIVARNQCEPYSTRRGA